MGFPKIIQNNKESKKVLFSFLKFVCGCIVTRYPRFSGMTSEKSYWRKMYKYLFYGWTDIFTYCGIRKPWNRKTLRKNKEPKKSTFDFKMSALWNNLQILQMVKNEKPLRFWRNIKPLVGTNIHSLKLTFGKTHESGSKSY